MKKSEAFAAKLPEKLKRQFSTVCDNLGLKKNQVVEAALREKLEDLMDTHDLRVAIKKPTGFHPMGSIKKSLK